MAKWGNCDYKQLQKLRDNLAKLQQVDLDKFCVDASKELAGRLLRLVIRRTPVGKYPKSSGKKGGTLRRNWTAGNRNVSEYVKSLPVSKSGNTYVIEVINPVKYASYVEYGHRKSNGTGWVPGQYFLTLSEQDLKRIAPAVLERKLEKMLKEVFRV